MKRIVLPISLGLNGLFFALLPVAWFFAGEPLRPPEVPPRSNTPSGQPAAEPATSAPVSGTATASVIRPFTWEQVESSDYRVYLANLRAIGCPESTVRDIIRADVGELYERREKALRAGRSAPDFWRTATADPRSPAPEGLGPALRRLALEHRTVIAALLGPEEAARIPLPEEESDGDPRLQSFTGQEQRRLRAIEQQNRARLADHVVRGLLGDARAREQDFDEVLRQIAAEREAALAECLDPERREEYELRASPTAEVLRQRLAGFEPTESEFRALFRLQQAFDREFGMELDLFGPSEGKRQAQLRLEEEFRVVLSEERYARYLEARVASHKVAVTGDD